MSILDLYRKKADEYFKGVYYQKRPTQEMLQQITPQEEPFHFSYTIIGESDRSVADLLTNLSTPQVFMTIKTDDPIPFPNDEKQHYLTDTIPLGYVVTEDGGLWIVQSYASKVVHDKGNQALRIRKRSLYEARYMRLVKISNMQGVK